VLKNFRSKYASETDADLERVLGAAREGPVVVMIEESDAAA
jgi:hypothetical protein